MYFGFLLNMEVLILTLKVMSGAVFHLFIKYKSSVPEFIHKCICTRETTTKKRCKISWIYVESGKDKNLVYLWILTRHSLGILLKVPEYIDLLQIFFSPILTQSPRQSLCPSQYPVRKWFFWSFLWQPLTFFLLHYWWGVPGSRYWRNKASFTYTFYLYPIKAYF